MQPRERERWETREKQREGNDKRHYTPMFALGPRGALRAWAIREQASERTGERDRCERQRTTLILIFEGARANAFVYGETRVLYDIHLLWNGGKRLRVKSEVLLRMRTAILSRLLTAMSAAVGQSV